MCRPFWRVSQSARPRIGGDAVRFAAYLRVSTSEQDSEAAQLAAIRSYVERADGSLVAIESDKLTGLDSSRPGYLRVLEQARRGEIDAVVVWRLDRFGRDPAEALRAFGELARLKVELHSVSEPSIDEDMRGLLAVLAGRESRVTSQRVRLSMRAWAATGSFQTTPPPGYRLVGEKHARRLEPNQDAPTITRAFTEMATGQYSLRQMQAKLSAWGIKTSRGTPLSRGLVHRLFTNQAYLGHVVYGTRPHGKFPSKLPPVVYKDAHPAVVDAETFRRVQEALKSHKRFPAGAGVRQSRYMLTGLTYCGHCGSRLYGTTSGKRFAYACSRSVDYGDCALGRVGGIGVDEYVQGELSVMRLITSQDRKAAEALLRAKESERSSEADAQRRQLERRRDQLESDRVNRGRSALAGLVPADVYTRIEHEDAAALAIINRELAGLAEVTPLSIDRELAFLGSNSARLPRAPIDFDDFDSEAWQDFARLFIDRVTIRRPEGGERSNRWHLNLDVEIVWRPGASLIRQAVTGRPEAASSIEI
jgi:DNA invertase Pin-like site-specific DNA recombinase